MKQLRVRKKDRGIQAFKRIAGSQKRPNVRSALMASSTTKLIDRNYKSFSKKAPELHAASHEHPAAGLATVLRETYSLKQRDTRAHFDFLTTKKIPGGRCFYCRSSKAVGLDHVLPKDVYAAHSLNLENLVPCCTRCNSSKWKHPFAEAGERLFLYAFKDVVPDVQWLFARAQFSPKFSIKFEFSGKNIVDIKIRKVLENQTKRLKLLKRFERDFARTGWSDIRVNVDTSTVQSLLLDLKKCARNYRREHGPNNYLGLAFEALSKSDIKKVRKHLREGL